MLSGMLRRVTDREADRDRAGSSGVVGGGEDSLVGKSLIGIHRDGRGSVRPGADRGCGGVALLGRRDVCMASCAAFALFPGRGEDCGCDGIVMLRGAREEKTVLCVVLTLAGGEECGCDGGV